MMKPLGAMTTFVAAVVLCCAATCVAAGDLVKVIPKDAFGFVVVNNLAEADAKIQQMAKRMQCPAPDVKLKALAGLGKGFDENRPIGLAAVPGEDASPMPVPVLYVPVTDFRDFAENLGAEDPSAKVVEVKLMGRPVVIGFKKGYAVVAPQDQRSALKRLTKKGKGIAPAVKDLSGYLAEQDVAAVLTPSGVNVLAAAAQQGLGQLKQVLEENENTAAQAGFVDMYSDFVKVIRKETDRVALGVRIDGDGNLRVSKRVRFNPEGSIAPALENAKPHRGPLLTGLPSEPFVMVVGGIVPGELYGPMMEFSKDLMKSQQQLYGIPPDKVDEVMGLWKESGVQVEAMAFMMGIGEPGAPLYSNMIVVTTVPDAPKYLAEYRNSVEKMSEITKGNEGFMSGMTIEPVDIDGTEGLKLVMKLPIGELGDDENVKALMEKMYGADATMTAYMAAIDERTVAIAYTTPNGLKAVRQALKQDDVSLAADEGIVATQKLLPEGAQWVGFWSPSGTVAFANRMFEMMEAVTGETIRAPEFPETPPVGFAALATPDGMESEMVVPAQLLEAVGKYIVEVQKLQAEPGAQPF